MRIDTMKGGLVMSLVPAFNPSVLICPCNGASIQCGTYATTNAGSNNV